MARTLNCGCYLLVKVDDREDSFCNSVNGCHLNVKGQNPIYDVPDHEGQELYLCRCDPYRHDTSKLRGLEAALTLQPA